MSDSEAAHIGSTTAIVSTEVVCSSIYLLSTPQITIDGTRECLKHMSTLLSVLSWPTFQQKLHTWS